MKKKVSIALLVTIVLLLRVLRVGPLSAREGVLARRYSSRSFVSAEWRSKDRVARGAMLAALFRGPLQHPTTNRQVTDLLGPTECYVDYEDEPCYALQLGGELYLLEFGVNHSDAPGKIVSVDLNGVPPL